MKYTLSKDGIMRVNLRAVRRVTKEELAQLKEVAKHEQTTLQKLLDNCLMDGLSCAISAYEDDKLK